MEMHNPKPTVSSQQWHSRLRAKLTETTSEYELEDLGRLTLEGDPTQHNHSANKDALPSPELVAYHGSEG